MFGFDPKNNKDDRDLSIYFVSVIIVFLLMLILKKGGF